MLYRGSTCTSFMYILPRLQAQRAPRTIQHRNVLWANQFQLELMSFRNGTREYEVYIIVVAVWHVHHKAVKQGAAPPPPPHTYFNKWKRFSPSQHVWYPATCGLVILIFTRNCYGKKMCLSWYCVEFWYNVAQTSGLPSAPSLPPPPPDFRVLRQACTRNNSVKAWRNPFI